MPLRSPIRISPNGRYFVHANGEPFFWLGDTAWPLFSNYSKDQAEAYLDARARQGFTVVEAIATWGSPNQNATGGGAAPDPNYTGETPWIDDSPANPNPRFFDHVEYLLRYADERGMILAIMPTWGYSVCNSRVVDADNAYVYGRWLGKRFRDQPNIVWLNGGDREPTGFEPIWQAQARGLREGDMGAHLMTYHPCGWRSSSYYFHNEDWLDFNMMETWTAWPSVHPAVITDMLMVPPKPVVLGEPAYENGPEFPLGPITPLVARRQAWWTHTAGGFITYGHDQMWRMLPGWTSAFDAPGARHMTIFRQTANSRPWWDMVPDQGLFASGVSSERTLNTGMRTLDRTCAMLYLSSQCHFVLYMDRYAAQRMKATWVNPQTGEEKAGGTYPTGSPKDGSIFPNRHTECLAVPDFWEDAVLILDKVE